MRRVQPEAATFILTGYPDFDTALQAIRSQVDDYMIKPTDVPTLVHAIRSRLENQRPNQPQKPDRTGPRAGSLGRKGGGRALAANPDETVIARPARCRHCQGALTPADQQLQARYDKIDLPQMRPIVTRVERYAGHCQCCGKITLAAVPEGLEPGTPFSISIVALAMYLRFVHAISYRRLSRLLLDLYGLSISEGALDAAFLRGKPRFDADAAAILARLRRARVICSDETSVRISGREIRLGLLIGAQPQDFAG